MLRMTELAVMLACLRCALGLHRWKPIARYEVRPDAYIRVPDFSAGSILWANAGFEMIGRRCACCGKRK